MSEAFDRYRGDYERVVQDSIAFSGLKHDFFLAAKVIRLGDLFRRHFGAARPSLLDIGCGVGRMHPHLRPIVGRLAGTDVSSESIDRARADNPWADYRLDRRSGLPWEDASFDATLAVCVLHHVPVAERAAFMAEMARLTRPGGLAVIIEHNPWNPLTRLAVARCPFDHDAVLLRHSEAAGRLRAAGFRAVETSHFLVTPSLGAPALKLDRLLARLPLGAQYMAFGVA